MHRGHSPPRPPPKDAAALGQQRLLRPSASSQSFKQSSTAAAAVATYDYSLAPPPPTLSLSSRPDLPEAFRDVVQISPNAAAAASSTLPETLHAPSASSSSSSSLHTRRTPSPRIAGSLARPAYSSNTRQAGGAAQHGGNGPHQFSTDMSASLGQPELPSQRMRNAAAAQNPFEQDEVEPAGAGRVAPPLAHHKHNAAVSNGSRDAEYESAGTVAPNRAKFTRGMTL